MSLLSDSDIASMRSTLTESLPGTAIIKAGTITGDSGGGGTKAWTPAGTVPCRIAPAAANERDVAGRLASDANWIVTLPAQTAVTVKNRLTIAGTDYEVLAVHAPRSYEISRRVEANQVA